MTAVVQGFGRLRTKAPETLHHLPCDAQIVITKSCRRHISVPVALKGRVWDTIIIRERVHEWRVSDEPAAYLSE